MYTRRFTEGHALLANDVVYQGSGEQNTGYVDLGDYHRGFVLIIPVNLSDEINVDVEEATDTTGTGAQSFDDGGKDTTIDAADTNPTVIEFRGEEFDVNDEYHCLNIETTPAGQSESYVVQVWGTVARYKPVPTTNLEAVVD